MRLSLNSPLLFLFCLLLYSCSQVPAEYVDNSSKVYRKSGITSKSKDKNHHHGPYQSSDREYTSNRTSADDQEIWDSEENENTILSSSKDKFRNESGFQNSSNFAIPNPMGNRDFIWPVDGRVVKHYNKASGIEGINIGAPSNTPVRAASHGKVIYVGGDLSEYGNLVIIKHDNDLLSAYAHLDSFLIKKGESVSKGSIVGTVGTTGDVHSPQLHFSIRKNDITINPEKIL